ncbi:ORF1 [Marmot associated torque teno virus]|nr:ORF1 [Marmot associated torque teno virus]
MAWYHGRSYRRRRGYRRRWWRRRRGYRRRAHRRRFRGRRHRGRKVLYLKEVQPRYRVRCVIRGWWPVLVSGFHSPLSTDDNKKKNDSFKPTVAFGEQTSWWYSRFTGDLILGGYCMGAISLNGLYDEHKAGRNRWSRSNCGFDLVRYLGSTVYFVPHKFLDYIVYIDPEYKTMDLFKKQSMHPAAMLTHPNTRIIRSIEHGGPRRKLPRFRIPRPAHWDDGWIWMSDVAKWGLFAFYVSWIDLESPFIAHVDDPNNVKWWSDTGTTAEQGPKWMSKFKEQQNKAPGQQLTDFYGGLTNSVPQDDVAKLDYGPFILKAPGPGQVGGLPTYPQITAFYKCHFLWGGSTAGIKEVCDPAAWEPPSQAVHKPEINQPFRR